MEYRFRREFLSESRVVLHKKHRWVKAFQQLFDLDAGKYVDIIERLIPNVEMRLFTKGACRTAAGEFPGPCR